MMENGIDKPMKVLITGGAGFLGSRMARVLLERGKVAGRPLGSISLADLVLPPPDLLRNPLVQASAGPLLQQASGFRDQSFDLVFHLAAAVSGECEADLDLGLRANLDTTRGLIDALRGSPHTRLVFSSSVAVFGGDAGLPMPTVITDTTVPVPQTSYGIQKFMCEQLIADYGRRNLFDGRSVRLATVSVRPGKPNAAASGFLSGIVREPLNGQQAICPVDPEAVVALASPQRAIAALLAAAEATPEAWGGRTALNMPALSIRVGEMIDALETVAGRAVRDRIVMKEDATISRMVHGWPGAFDTPRALRLGLTPDPDFASIIRQHQQEQSPTPA